MVSACCAPGWKRSRACTFALAVAAWAEDVSRVQPHEHWTSGVWAAQHAWRSLGELRRLLDRQLARLRTPEDLVYIDGPRRTRSLTSVP